MTNTNLTGYTRPARKSTLGALLGATMLMTQSSAFAADSDIDELRRELAAQQLVIDRLVAAQEAQRTAGKKTATVPAIDQAPATVSPPSSLSIYGVADVNVARSDSGFGQKTTIGSGGMTASRLGIKGERQLGGGLKAIGVAEAGVLLNSGGAGNSAVVPGINDTNASSGGQNGTGSQLFSRQIYAGLASTQIGSLTIGRQYSGSYGIASNSNAMGTGFFGYSGSFLPLVGMPTRLNNSIAYFTPTIQGVTGQLVYTAGSENNTNSDVPTSAGASTKTNDKAGRGYDLSAVYLKGNFYAGASTWLIYNTSYAVGETGLARKTGWQASVSYDFGVVRLFATGVQGRIGGENYAAVTKSLSKSSGWSVSAAVPFGKSKLLATYSSLDDESALNRDGKLFGVAYVYQLYANTNLYAAWGKQDNNRNASYSLADGGDLVGNAAKPGADAKGTMAGVNIAF